MSEVSKQAIASLHNQLTGKQRNSVLTIQQVKKIFLEQHSHREIQRSATADINKRKLKDLGVDDPPIIIEEKQKLQKSLQLLNETIEPHQKQILSPRFFRNSFNRRMEEQTSKYIEMEKFLEQHQYLSEDHDLILDAIENQSMLLKVDIKNKIFPLHVRFYSKQGQLRVHYSSHYIQPNRKNSDASYHVVGDQVIRQEKSPGDQQEYVYLNLEFERNTRFKISCWFSRPKIERQTEEQLRETQQMIEDFERRTGLKSGRRVKTQTEQHTFAEIYEVMEKRKQKMRQSLAKRNFIQKNREGARSFREHKLDLSARKLHHERIETAIVYSDFYEKESHAYNLYNYIKKHSNRRDKIEQLNHDFKVKWFRMIKLIKVYLILHNTYLKAKEQYFSNGARTNPFKQYTMGMRVQNWNINQRCLVDCRQSLLLFAIVNEKKLKAKSEQVICFTLKNLFSMKIGTTFKQKATLYYNKSINIEDKISNKNIEVLQDAIDLMVKGVLRELEQERTGLDITPDDRVFYIKYLDKGMRDFISLSYLSELMHSYKRVFHQYYQATKGGQLTDFTELRKPKVTLVGLIARIKAQQQRENFERQLALKKRRNSKSNVRNSVKAPVVKTQNDLITERYEKRRQTLLMMPFLDQKPDLEEKTQVPTLKLYSRRDFLKELVIQNLDFLKKTRK